ncbi:hypothetical protein EHQ53_15660 [Leptospira langatensis]|uniref:Uncharacterized protein n=1 Tax=Leptospira langatensis TaxID=2484983 RepID=A0A5F1ZQT9_9LEPT|nr:hypothetical protein [Leptospira langatensis]TGK01901.1 hypothetical protein EHO57_08900 [Leptospira langatensis]TGL39506.1 hypothetical protein EHQ53_15660 [Leptospira langatensis]
MKSILRPIVFVFLLIFVTDLYSEVPKHSEMDKILLNTWNKTFPVPYTRILKRDLSGKGVLYYRRSAKKSVYIYSFVVFLPLYAEEGERPVQKEGGREIKLKLIYDPSSQEEKYTIELGEFDEIYDAKGIIRWIR